MGLAADEEQRRTRAKERNPTLSLLAILATGWTLLFVVVGGVALQQESFRIEREFMAQSDELFERSHGLLQQSGTLLEGFAAYVRTHPEATLAERRQFTARMLAARPGWFLEIVDRVAAADLEAYIRHQRATIYDGFEVRSFDYTARRQWQPVRGKEEYLPIGFIDPLPSDTLPVLGLDVSAEETLRPVFEAAQVSQAVAATAPFVVAEGFNVYGLVAPIGLSDAEPGAGRRYPWRPAFAELIASASAQAQLFAEFPRLTVQLLHDGGGRLYPYEATESAAEEAAGAEGPVHFEMVRRFEAPFSAYYLTTRLVPGIADFNLYLLGAIALAAFVSFALVLVYAVVYHRRAVASLRGNEQWFRLANFDSLTGLPNRNLLLDRIETALARARRSKNLVVVLFLDLDGFKAVNDSHGHAFGDEVLRQVAERLSAVVRETDTVARLGGDEFVILLDHLLEEEPAYRLIREVKKAFAQPFAVAQARAAVGVSVGVAIYPQDALSAEQLLHRADISMYQHKHHPNASTGQRQILDAIDGA